MIDIDHDAPTPIHEQITSQIMAHVAARDLAAGTRLADFRAFAKEILANPQVVARAYGDLEWEGVLKKHPDGGMVVVEGADVVCRQRIALLACQRLREAVRHAKSAGLTDVEIKETIEQTLTAPPVPTLTQAELRTSIKKSTTHATSHRDSQGIQDLSR